MPFYAFKAINWELCHFLLVYASADFGMPVFAWDWHKVAYAFMP